MPTDPPSSSAPDPVPDPAPVPEGMPDLSQLSTIDPAAYEWLLSDHPWAVAERARRRADYEARELATAAKVREWSDRTRARAAAGELDQRPPGWRENLERLAELMGPRADEGQLRTTLEAAEPDELKVIRDRRHLETSRQVAGEDDYIYPPHLIGPGAAAYPPPASGRTTQ